MYSISLSYRHIPHQFRLHPFFLGDLEMLHEAPDGLGEAEVLPTNLKYTTLQFWYTKFKFL